MTTRPTISRRTRLALAAPVLLAAAGCYDSVAMLERVRNDAIQSRLEEVDLGDFHVTLPKDSVNSETTEVFIDMYGRAARYRIAGIKQKIKENGFSYREDILLAIRDATNEELADPNLTQLRERLFTATNAALGDTPVEKVGIAYLRLVRH